MPYSAPPSAIGPRRSRARRSHARSGPAPRRRAAAARRARRREQRGAERERLIRGEHQPDRDCRDHEPRHAHPARGCAAARRARRTGRPRRARPRSSDRARRHSRASGPCPTWPTSQAARAGRNGATAQRSATYLATSRSPNVTAKPSVRIAADDPLQRARRNLQRPQREVLGELEVRVDAGRSEIQREAPVPRATAARRSATGRRRRRP